MRGYMGWARVAWSVPKPCCVRVLRVSKRAPRVLPAPKGPRAAAAALIRVRVLLPLLAWCMRSPGKAMKSVRASGMRQRKH
jgi:hypothetical protein